MESETRRPLGLRVGTRSAECALLFLRRSLRRRMRGAGEHGVIAAVAGEQDGETDRGEHKEDGGPGGELGEEVGCSAGAEGCLRTLSAEGTGEVRRLALLNEDDADKEEADDDVKSYDESDHAVASVL